MPFHKVAVIGAGVMGAGIAAQIANAGVQVLLLDVAADGTDRDAVARAAIGRMLKAEPAPFMTRRAAGLIEPGNTDDAMARLIEYDWIIEAVVERLDVKRALYRRIDAVRRPDAAVSSNTSTIPLARLIEGMPETFAKSFLITHFFNPPRHMRLLEVVAGPATDPHLTRRVSEFCDVCLGKTPVICHDTPGFIANRIGTYWLQLGVGAAMDLGLTVEEADAVVGKPMGIPKTGVFGLLDLVGLDLMPHIVGSLAGALPDTDPFHATLREFPLLDRLIAMGHTGRKGKGGFYRIDRAGGGKAKLALELTNGEYRSERKPDLPEWRGVKAVVTASGKFGDYAWRVLGRTLAYAASLIPEAAADITAIDEAMRLGYNWKQGPFELVDALGAGYVTRRLNEDGIAVPPLLALGLPFYRVEAGRRQFLSLDGAYRDVSRAAGILLLADIKAVASPVLKNGSAALWDIGDGVACFEMTSKMGSFDLPIIELLRQSIDVVGREFKALVISHDGANFSAGANLALALFAANIAAWGEIDKLVTGGQTAFKMLKYAPFPVVAAPFGLALGGGCEIVLHADAIQAHAETYMGLVECGVGLIPGWGGCGEMIERWRTQGRLPLGPMPAVAKAFEQISTATTSKSAAEARDMMFLRPGDGITMNRDRLLADAKARALAMVDGYRPPKRPEFSPPGASGCLGMTLAAEGFARRGVASAHDVRVASALAGVLSGGPADLLDTVSEQAMLDLEREAFLRLIRLTPTLARIEHTLATGKPLRN